MRLALLLILATLAGVVTVLGFAPYRIYWIMPLSLAILANTLSRGGKHAFWLGYAWGLSSYLCNFNWIFISLHDVAGMPAWLAVPLTVLLPAYLALYPGLAAWMTIRIGDKCGAGAAERWLLLFPAAWTLMEWLRGWMLSGFPWGQVGYSQITESPLAGYAPVGGILLVTLLVALSAGGLQLAVSSGKWRRACLAAGLIALWGGGLALKPIAWTTPVGKPITVALAQGNVPQSLKWNPISFESTLRLYGQQIAETRADLMILPETALPALLSELPPNYIQILQSLANHNGMAVAAGVPRRSDSNPNGYLNSVVALTTPGMPYYAKNHLVPFGEFVPLPILTGWLYQWMNMPLSGFSRGGDQQAPLALAGQQIAFNVCYEDSFGEELIGPAAHSTMLANVSNLAWFGKSTAASQHLQLAQARALETGRFMLRSTNTGMTAIIRPDGAVDAIAAPFTRQVLLGFAEGRTGLTPFMRYGNLPVLLAGVLMLFAPLIRLRRRAPSERPRYRDHL
ncbi:apolipoprotein N-acyltransferase [Paludibacterium purpuratum]|uniref:Apolipoprotein N-acyltransferase n=2 Tax=Paludibacterium purpuratum TaxID=1144873 RepID=A0A4R7B9A6_9NEIS|nr:apolipoprotein N-acyltransferase [Paludibacterium purpuratum]